MNKPTQTIMGPEELKRTLTNAQHFQECTKDPDVLIVLPNGRQYFIENVGIGDDGNIVLYAKPL